MEYKLITQLPYCCVAGCIEIILKKYNINNLNQEEIAQKLGLIMPYDNKKELEKYFKEKDLLNFTSKKPLCGFGTQINRRKYSLQQFVRNEELPLNVKILKIEKINFEKLLRAKKENEDLILCFNYNQLYGFGNDGGHVSIFVEINGDEITLLDPDTKYLPYIKKVKLQDLYDSIQHHENGFGGIWKFVKNI